MLKAIRFFALVLAIVCITGTSYAVTLKVNVPTPPPDLAQHSRSNMPEGFP